MGGGSGSGSGVTPTTPSGYTGGSVMDFTPTAGMPTISGGGPNYWAMIGGGLQSAGKGIASGAGSVPSMGDVPQLGGPQDYGSPQQPPSTIPQNNLLEALMRLISGT